MKQTIISAFMVFVLAGVANAQISSLRLTFSESIDPSTNVPTGSVKFIIDGQPTLQLFEAIIPAATEAECFASRDFSNARPVSPDRATLTYDEGTGSYTVKWVGVDKRATCRVLLAGRTIAGTDLGVWQSNYGAGGFAEKGMVKNDGSAPRSGDGSVRPVRYSISLNPMGTQTTLGVKYPGQDGELIEARFPDAPDRHFLIFEGALPAATDAECLANTDFSSLVSADPNRTTMSYSPTTATWYLRNSNSPGAPSQGCRAVLADGDGAVDGSDYAVWRTNFGSTGFAGEERALDGTESGSAASRPRQPTPPAATTYVFRPVVQNQ